MEVNAPVVLHLDSPSAVGEARRRTSTVARDAGLSEVDVGRAAIVATESASNLVKHAGGGDMLVTAIRHRGHQGVQIVALDGGAGLVNPGESFRDGFSTTGTQGTGLGAISRQSDVFDVYSTPGQGTGLLCRIWAGRRTPDTGSVLVGGISVPRPGEDVCGDGWAIVENGNGALVLVCDGLGHGPLAAEASTRAAEVFLSGVESSPASMIERLHDALRPTRGAAVAVAELDRQHQVVRFSGIGNIAGRVLGDGPGRAVVSHHGIVGHSVHKVQEFQYPWPSGGLLVLHSDGIVTHWTLDPYPGLSERHPALIAAIVYRDFRRGRDDATVVVLREAQ